MDNLVQFKADEEIKKTNIGLKVPSLNMVGQIPNQSSNNMTPICYTSGNNNATQNRTPHQQKGNNSSNTNPKNKVTILKKLRSRQNKKPESQS